MPTKHSNETKKQAERKTQFLSEIVEAMAKHGCNDLLIVYRLNGMINNTALTVDPVTKQAEWFAILSDQIHAFLKQKS